VIVSGKPRPRHPRLSREEKKAATREALLDAATRVFARQGYVSTSVDEVAWEAGMTKGAVYSNFGSKDDLFAAVIERHQDRRMLAIARNVDPSAPLSEQTAFAGEQFMAALDRDFVLLGLEYTLHAARHPSGHQAMRERYRRMKSAIAAMIEQHEETATDIGISTVLPIEELVVAFFAIGDGIALERLSEPDDVADDLYGKMLGIFVRGLQATAEDQAETASGSSRRAPSRSSAATRRSRPRAVRA
jgi:AcrR family transcriptional regulator